MSGKHPFHTWSIFVGLASRAPGTRVLRGVLRRERGLLLRQLPGYSSARLAQATCDDQDASLA